MSTTCLADMDAPADLASLPTTGFCLKLDLGLFRTWASPESDLVLLSLSLHSGAVETNACQGKK
jgi:hypothetical protein